MKKVKSLGLVREMPPGKQRRSRKDKLEAILNDYLAEVKAQPPSEPDARPEMTQFQSGFYDELMVCKGPFCQSIHRFHTNGDALVPRAQVIGYMYKMHGGAAIIDDPTVIQKLTEIFGNVGLTITKRSGGEGE